MPHVEKPALDAGLIFLGCSFLLRDVFLRRSGKVGAKNTARVENRVSPTPSTKKSQSPA
jgi:hypothetical protein